MNSAAHCHVTGLGYSLQVSAGSDVQCMPPGFFIMQVLHGLSISDESNAQFVLTVDSPLSCLNKSLILQVDMHIMQAQASRVSSSD